MSHLSTLNFVDAFQIRTANDAPGRDPASYELYGFNGALITTDSGPSPAINQTGLAEAWTLINMGSITLPGNPTIGNDQRGVLGPVEVVGSTTPYQHYKMIFPTIKRPTDNIMQFADIQFFTNRTDPFTGSWPQVIRSSPWTRLPSRRVGAALGAVVSRRTKRRTFGIDQRVDPVTMLPNSKYLNFGEERSGIIITNSDGPVDVNCMGLTTANDALARDPMTYQLYGTNDPITSEQNSNSNGTEVWTLISEGPTNLPGVLPDGGGDDARLTQVLIPVNSPADYSVVPVDFPHGQGCGPSELDADRRHPVLYCHSGAIELGDFGPGRPGDGSCCSPTPEIVSAASNLNYNKR